MTPIDLAQHAAASTTVLAASAAVTTYLRVEPVSTFLLWATVVSAFTMFFFSTLARHGIEIASLDDEPGDS